ALLAAGRRPRYLPELDRPGANLEPDGHSRAIESAAGRADQLVSFALESMVADVQLHPFAGRVSVGSNQVVIRGTGTSIADRGRMSRDQVVIDGGESRGRRPGPGIKRPLA